MIRTLILAAAFLLASPQEHLPITHIIVDWGDGSALSMQFSLTNKSDATAKGSLRLYDGDGQEVVGLLNPTELTLAPNQTVILKTEGASDPIQTGYALASFDREGVSALAIFRLSSGAEAGVLPTELGHRFSLLVERKAGLDTGVAVYRPGQPQDITAKLFDVAGNLVRQGPFPNFAFHAARNVGEIFTDLPAQFTGSLELSCECLFAPVGLRFGSVLSTVTVSDLVAFEQDVTEIHNRHLPFGLPLGTPKTNDLIVREIYALSSNDETKFADWVAYRLDLATIDGPSQFELVYLPDPYLDPDETLEPEDYDGAFAELGVDRGHLAPLASFVGTPYWRDTNYLSNIAPQESGLSRGGWLTVENEVRDLVRGGNVVYVMTGTVYDGAYDPLPGADEPHRVPSGFYKIVLVIGDDNGIEATAFIFNQEDRGDIQQRIVSIDEVERRTGLDFLAGMEDGAEDALEAEKGVWPLP